MKPATLVFDLNGTLLDMSVLDPHFFRIFGDASFREKWFEQLQVLWMSTMLADTLYQPFDKLAGAALQMLAKREGIELSKADSAAVKSQMTELPAYPEVPLALQQLREAGFPLVVLTNGTAKSARAQVKYAGLSRLFDDVFSVDAVKRYKPAPEPYRYVARQLGRKPKQLMLVAAHSWDIGGAMQLGFQTAFVARPRQVMNPLASKPDYVVNDLAELVRKLV